MTIAERIMLVVEETGGNMSAFARELNVTPAYISKLGKNPNSVPSDRTILDICTKFGVSESWLRTGDGEMFLPLTREEEIAKITADLYTGSDAFKLELIKCVAEMSPELEAELARIAHRLVEAQEKGTT